MEEEKKKEGEKRLTEALWEDFQKAFNLLAKEKSDVKD